MKKSASKDTPIHRCFVDRFGFELAASAASARFRFDRLLTVEAYSSADDRKTMNVLAPIRCATSFPSSIRLRIVRG